MKKLVVCMLLALCLSTTAAGCGKKEDPKKTEATTKTKQTEKEENKEYQVIGNKTEEAFDILLKNSTGQDISGISVKTSDKTEWPANMMKTGETLKAGDTAELFYTPEKSAAADAQAAAGTDKAINVIYNVQVTLADGSVLELSSFGFEDIEKEAELCYEESVAYLKYTSKASGDAVSTKEQELGAKAQREAAAAQAAAAAAAAQDAQNAAGQQGGDTYTEPAYTEPSYTEPAYTEPSYTEPTYTEPVEQAPSQGSEGCLNPGDVVINPQ